MNICPDEIVFDLDANNRQQAIERAATLLAAARKLDPALIFRALWRREQAGSTALGKGVAIPHARVAGITTPAVLFARTARPIEFRAPDGKPVSILYVMLVPSDGSTEEHLRRLAMVAQAFSDPALRDSLATFVEPSSIRQAFVEADSRIQQQLQPGRDGTRAAPATAPSKNV